MMHQKNAELAEIVLDDQYPYRARAVFEGPRIFIGDGTPAWMIY